MSLLFFGFIAAASIVQTSVIDPDNFVQEVILYEKDHVLANIVIILLFLMLAFLLSTYKNVLNKINEKAVILALVAYTIVLGLGSLTVK